MRDISVGVIPLSGLSITLNRISLAYGSCLDNSPIPFEFFALEGDSDVEVVLNFLNSRQLDDRPLAILVKDVVINN